MRKDVRDRDEQRMAGRKACAYGKPAPIPYGEPAPSKTRAYSSASRQISTETSSTLSGIGGSGLVTFTHTPSSS